MTTQRMFDVVKAKRCRTCQQRFTSEAAFCPFDGEPLTEAAADPVKDPMIGTLVDNRYEIIEALGEGGMGSVYKVRHKVLSRMFAMKVLRREMAREKELCARFIQEARTAATIAHSNVVQINDYGNLPDGTPYFVMELLEGQPLSRLIKAGGPLPAGRAVRIIQQIAAGLGAAHRAGVIHRDLKPDNVFVGETDEGRDQVKILDFGVAKVAGAASMTRTGMVFGSPHYMSPEQASGQPVDHRADLYAMGVIMYELFTGRVPFEADTFMGVLTKHMFMTPEPFQIRVGDAARELGALEDITLRCLEKKPENRYPTMEALVAAIEEVVELGNDDVIDVRPSSAGHERRSAMSSFRLADEMEPPLAGEVSAARARRGARDRETRLALVAMILASCMLVVALAAVVWSRSKPEASSAASATPSRAVEVQPSPTPSQPAMPVVPAQTADAPPPTASTQPTATVREPPRTTGVRTPVRSTATSTAAPTVPGKKPPPSAGGEIVNPWSD